MANKAWPEILVLSCQDGTLIGVVTRKIQAVGQDIKGHCTVWVDGAEGRYDTFLVKESFGTVLGKLHAALRKLREGRQDRKPARDITTPPSPEIFTEVIGLGEELADAIVKELSSSRPAKSEGDRKAAFQDEKCRYIAKVQKLSTYLSHHISILQENPKEARDQFGVLAAFFENLINSWPYLEG